MHKLYLLLILIFSLTHFLCAQSARKINREGIEHYQAGDYEKSEKSFKKALKENKQLIEASYNIALSYYKQEKYNEAVNQFKNTIPKTSDKEVLAKVYHNLGNSYLQLNKLKESIDAYQNALKLNPSDEETRYNLTYALLKLKARQKNQQQDTKQLLDKIEQEENTSQQFMRRNKNRGKEMKNW